MKKIREILAFLKNVVWPVAKPFICASKEEAIEARDWMLSRGVQSGSIGEGGAEFPDLDIMPELFHRIEKALENE